ncbi:hypothetical protein V490_04144 [Pseudogymnoascus sp. VKM F-3557]|nr:hypothetical protein V490_04144 [Pseudogymnoascus sp. VKM F-3557]
MIDQPSPYARPPSINGAVSGTTGRIVALIQCFECGAGSGLEELHRASYVGTHGGSCTVVAYVSVYAAHSPTLGREIGREKLGRRRETSA